METDFKICWLEKGEKNMKNKIKKILLKLLITIVTMLTVFFIHYVYVSVRYNNVKSIEEVYSTELVLQCK